MSVSLINLLQGASTGALVTCPKRKHSSTIFNKLLERFRGGTYKEELFDPEEMPSFRFKPNTKILSFIFAFVYLFISTGFCFLPPAKAALKGEVILREQTTLASKITLFAKSGNGDFYTLYPNGLSKEEAYIGSFNSAQLDPQEENIYFYDTGSKVISRINLKDQKVYKVIGKPKSNAAVDYSSPVKFSDASLTKLTDFTFDKYGNIFILDSNLYSDNTTQNPRILKASLKDGTIQEVFKINDQFRPIGNDNFYKNSNNFGFTLDSLSYDKDRFIYLTGTITSILPGYGIWNWDYSPRKSLVILKLDTLSNTIEIFGGTRNITEVGYSPKIILATNPDSFNLKGIAFDHDKTCYISSNELRNSSWSFYTSKVVPSTNNDGSFKLETFIGDGSGSPSDIGDGGSVKGAYAGLIGSRCLCGDKSGDIYIADSATWRVRKILKDSGLITTVVGGGSESLSFGQFKAPRSVSLNSPSSLLVDKSNNLYIVENSRILLVNNLITHDDKPQEQVKVASLKITKIAGNEIENPKGDISLPDLSLDYTNAGDQTIEVKGENIPDGTNIKLLTTNVDGTSSSNIPSTKLASGLASIPVKIEAGTTKIVKAETDPFIPAPGVYLPGTEPKIVSGELPPEPVSTSLNRNNVNKTKNLISPSGRFDFTTTTGWRHSYFYNNNNTIVKSNTAIDPDNLVNDASLITFGAQADAIYLPNIAPGTNKTIFSVWIRTDSGNVNVPIGIGPYCDTSSWTGCISAFYFGIGDSGDPSQYAYTTYATSNVTPSWQKFSVTSNSNQDAKQKTLIIGGLNQTINQKIYVWGARLEAQ